jgi:hypothetical protein
VDEAVPLGGRVTDWLALRMCWPSHKIAIYMLSGVSERRGGTAMLQAGVPPQALVSEDGLNRRKKGDAAHVCFGGQTPACANSAIDRSVNSAFGPLPPITNIRMLS